MGGCCCCSSRRTELHRTPVHIYCPRAVEGHEPLSSICGTTAISPGLLVHTSLDMSSPDTYRAPPAPLPYDTTLPESPEILGSKTDQVHLSESQPLPGIIGGSDFEGCMKETNCRNKSNSAYVYTKVTEDELSRSTVSVTFLVEEEDVCPTCLEEYDTDNPRITTKCKHYFHLSCILEWRERSDTCPICDQIMVIDDKFN